MTTRTLQPLAGQVALVTGAGRMRGIGRATAVRLAAEGADVAVCAMPRQVSELPDAERGAGWTGAESVAEEIRGMGRRALALSFDVTSAVQVEEACARAEAELGIPTIVVNNAGVAGSAGTAPIATLSEVDWRRVLDVNLTGAFLVARAAVGRMLAEGRTGSIINVSSIAGRMPFAGMGAYCAAKFGLIGFTQQLALELAQNGIRVNCLCPGATDTDMVSRTHSEMSQMTGVSVAEMAEMVTGTVPLGRFSSPAEQAGVIAFLAGPDSSYLTGQSINSNGGSRMD